MPDEAPVAPDPWTLVLAEIDRLRVQQSNHAERNEVQHDTLIRRLNEIDARLAAGKEKLESSHEKHDDCEEWRKEHAKVHVAHETVHDEIKGKVLSWSLVAVLALLLTLLAAILTGTIKVL